MVVAFIESKRPSIEQVCRRFRVARLEVLGSAADGNFDPNRSDIDFLVDSLPLPSGTMFDTYLGLLESLEMLFDHKVDLLDGTCLRNPHLLHGVNETPRVVFQLDGDRELVP